MFFQRLFKYLQKNDGVFFEAGANDGVNQSYTFKLEKNYNWTGVLVEPSYSAFIECEKNRPNSICINAAITDDTNISEIMGDFDGSLMSSVNGMRKRRGNSTKVPATTLTCLFDKYLLNKQVDLMSIDVENYEFNVLKSLDFSRYQPTFILVEIYKEIYSNVENLLKNNGYILIENITNFNKIDNPGWDGTHNDYLFKVEKL